MHDNLQEVLKQYWGYNGFRPLQEEAMKCVMHGVDSVVVLPTGGGKSLCFQAPSMIMHGMALVVSPLISLMKDQIDSLTECGIPAARIDSSLLYKEKAEIIERIRGDNLKLLYVSPERLVTERFRDLLSATKVSFIAIDEAHCVSTWGHDFRPEYRELGILKNTFPGIAIHAYTATATDRVRSDLAEQLGLKNPEFLVGSFDRPNLVFKVERASNKLKQIRTVMDRHKGESGIVYCIRRKDVDKYCEKLTGLGYGVAPYHAGLSDADRKRNQDAFIKERVDTIVATVAFGMGIDKSNVRYVVHAGMPKSLEHYQQESGRAGRDGLEAECRLIYSGGDFRVWKTIVEDSEPEAQEIALNKLTEIYNYCTGIACRHKALVNYFGQDFAGNNCGACDVCLGDVDRLDDSLVTAQKIISCVLRLHERFGAAYTTSVLVGSRESRILQSGHDSLSTYGLLSDFSVRVVRDWLEQLVSQDCMQKTGDYSVLNVTEKGWRVLRGQETPILLKPSEKAPKAAKTEKDSWDGVDRALFEKLRELRREIAEIRNVPAYVVFPDFSLRDMARRLPATKEELLQVTGVGKRKCAEYGDTFLNRIKEHAER